MDMQSEYLTIKQLSTYAGLGQRTIRYFLTSQDHPLPHFRISHKIIRISRKEFDVWMEHFKSEQNSSIDEVVTSIMKCF